MNAERRAREKALFEELVELGSTAERQSFLDRACADDPALRRQLEELLARQEPAETLLTALPSRRGRDPESYAGERLAEAKVFIGRYQLQRRLGSGGCGVVYLAEQQEPVRRQVALKIIRLGMDTENVIARFELERQALAIMDHPNIARVLDAGTTDTGRPYFVMELVQGIKITDYCAQNRLSTERRLRLFIQVCHALQHAHQKGIIHRDIKPSNILVATQDGRPVPKVIDFGIAKAIEPLPGDSAGLTAHLHLVGTPAYMSPEQADIGSPDLDTRSDIYSLGVLLHELLTGRTPFDSRELEAGGLDAMRRILREREAPRASSVLASLPPDRLRVVAEQQRTEPARLVAHVRGDLDWIVATTLEKDRSRRYETANGLAMDIRRFLAHELVVARPPSRMYRLGKLVRRNRVVFVAGTLVLVSLLGGFGASTWLFLRERETRRAQEVLLAHAEAGEKMAQAAVALSYDKYQEADILVESVPYELLRPSLETVDVLRKLGEWHVVAGRWSSAARRYFGLAQVIIRVDESDTDRVSFDLMPAASAILESRNLEAYQTFRDDIIERFAHSKNPLPTEQVLKSSLLAPASPESLAALRPLAEVVRLTIDGDTPATSDNAYLSAWRCFVLALLELRRGQPNAALNWCDRSQLYANVNAAREVSIDLVRALAFRQLGRDVDAARLVEQCRIRVEERFTRPLETWEPETHTLWFDWVNARILLREARAHAADA